MQDSDDRELASGLRDGSPAAWHALYERYCRRVWASVARMMGGSSSDVADVVQESFLAAARSARNYDPARGSLWVWLFGIARRHVALHFRKQGRHDRLHQSQWQAGREQVLRWLDRGDDASTPLEAAETAALVRAALTELPAEYGALLTARYLEGVEVAQLAAEEGCSETAVRSKLARARRAFRDAFLATPAGEAIGEETRRS